MIPQLGPENSGHGTGLIFDAAAQPNFGGYIVAGLEISGRSAHSRVSHAQRRVATPRSEQIVFGDGKRRNTTSNSAATKARA